MRRAERVEQAVDNGLGAFWAAVAEALPDVKSGDMDAIAVERFSSAARAAVAAWLDANGAGDHCPECGLDVAHDGHLPDCPIAETFVAYELLDDPADHECDCSCPDCVDQWRPEDASQAILEAERALAEGRA